MCPICRSDQYPLNKTGYTEVGLYNDDVITDWHDGFVNEHCDAIIDIDIGDTDVDIIDSVEGKCTLIQDAGDFENTGDSRLMHAAENVAEGTLVCNLEDDVVYFGDNSPLQLHIENRGYILVSSLITSTLYMLLF